MIIQCHSCLRRYRLDHAVLGARGAHVRCTACQHIWFQTPPPPSTKALMLRPRPLTSGRALGLARILVRWPWWLGGTACLSAGVAGAFALGWITMDQIRTLAYQMTAPSTKDLETPASGRANSLDRPFGAETPERSHGQTKHNSQGSTQFNQTNTMPRVAGLDGPPGPGRDVRLSSLLAQEHTSQTVPQTAPQVAPLHNAHPQAAGAQGLEEALGGPQAAPLRTPLVLRDFRFSVQPAQSAPGQEAPASPQQMPSLALITIPQEEASSAMPLNHTPLKSTARRLVITGTLSNTSQTAWSRPRLTVLVSTQVSDSPPPAGSTPVGPNAAIQIGPASSAGIAKPSYLDSTGSQPGTAQAVSGQSVSAAPPAVPPATAGAGHHRADLGQPKTYLKATSFTQTLDLTLAPGQSRSLMLTLPLPEGALTAVIPVIQTSEPSISADQPVDQALRSTGFLPVRPLPAHPLPTNALRPPSLPVSPLATRSAPPSSGPNLTPLNSPHH